MMRPHPPSTLFDDANSPAFAPTEDMPGWIDATSIDPASRVHNLGHGHLAHADIGFLWTIVGNSKKGRRVIGQCETGSPQGTMGKWSRAGAEMQVKQWFGHVPDFIITLDADYCRACGDAEFMALVEHELYHAAQDVDVFVAPTFSGSAGRPVFVIRAHETLAGLARRLGVAGVRAMVDAANQKPEIARVQSAHASGACQLRPA